MLVRYFAFLFFHFSNSCSMALDGGLTFVGGGREVRSLEGLVKTIYDGKFCVSFLFVM